MLYITKPKKVFLYCGIVDFRKQINGLTFIIESEIGKQHFEDSWFVFISRNKKNVKLIYWRDAGYALWQYRLESDLFSLGRPRSLTTKQISWRDLNLFLSGKNIFQGEPHSRKKIKKMS